MQIRIRKQNQDGMVRLESSGELKEILINEDILDSYNEKVSLCFRGKNSSGIIDLSPKEIEKLYDSVNDRIGTIKNFRKLSASGARIFK